ncbi:LysR substrate-binding domain-containing protein [Devosia sp.]|uniref:LysR substrate-binding domain-containing protein n=1 Tax=Devosia sp. TaxID=1871048 RepID=UPI002F0357EF
MVYPLPPLNPLHVFEVASRVGNFTHAAAELNVTQSAVSRQISILEAHLKVDLFRRGRQGVTLTAAGEEYRRMIGPAFAMIAEATAAVRDRARAKPLALLVYPTFAVKWLIPRLPLFAGEQPGIDVRVSTGTETVDFSKDGVDLAIQLVVDTDPPANSRRLFTDALQPICSPSLLPDGKVPATIDALLRLKLLHSRYRRDDWKDWLAAKGRPDASDDGMEFPSSILTYQAALEGLGVAIGQPRLVEQDIATGRLVALLPPPVERNLAYYAIWAPRKEPDIKVRRFLRWLERQVAAEGAPAPG